MPRLDVDLHISISDNGPGTADGMVRSAVDRDLQVIGLCRHNVIPSKFQSQVHENLGLSEGVIIVPASKIDTTFVPLLVYGVKPETEIKFDSPAEVMGLIDWTHSQGGVIVVPHLFRCRRHENWREIIAGEDGEWDWWIRKCDALERTWATCRSDDAFIQQLADRLSKRVVDGSDAHFARHVGKHRWTFETNRQTVDAVISNLREKG